MHTVEVARNVNHGTVDTNESIAELYDSGCSPDQSPQELQSSKQPSTLTADSRGLPEHFNDYHATLQDSRAQILNESPLMGRLTQANFSRQPVVNPIEINTIDYIDSKTGKISGIKQALGEA